MSSPDGRAVRAFFRIVVVVAVTDRPIFTRALHSGREGEASFLPSFFLPPLAFTTSKSHADV